MYFSCEKGPDGESFISSLSCLLYSCSSLVSSFLLPQLKFPSSALISLFPQRFVSAILPVYKMLRKIDAFLVVFIRGHSIMPIWNISNDCRRTPNFIIFHLRNTLLSNLVSTAQKASPNGQWNALKQAYHSVNECATLFQSQDRADLIRMS